MRKPTNEQTQKFCKKSCITCASRTIITTSDLYTQRFYKTSKVAMYITCLAPIIPFFVGGLLPINSIIVSAAIMGYGMVVMAVIAAILFIYTFVKHKSLTYLSI